MSFEKDFRANQLHNSSSKRTSCFKAFQLHVICLQVMNVLITNGLIIHKSKLDISSFSEYALSAY